MESNDDIWYYIFELIIKQKSVEYVCYNYTTINSYLNNIIYKRIKQRYINAGFIVNSKRINDVGVASLKYLDKLAIYGNSFDDKNTNISNDYLPAKISDYGIENLTNLQTLILRNTKNTITDICVRYLTNITELRLMGNEGITSHCIHYLTNLKSLTLSNNKLVTGICFKYLYTSLTDLDLSYNNKIMPKFISKLTTLKCLSLRENTKIHSFHITMLTNLTSLTISTRSEINMSSTLGTNTCDPIIDNTMIDNSDIITFIKTNKLDNLVLKKLTIFDYEHKPSCVFHKFSSLITLNNVNIEVFYRKGW